METITAPVPATPPPSLTARTPLSRRYTWIALIVAGVLPVILLVTIIALLMSANINFLEWME